MLYLEQFTESTEVQREHCSSEDWERRRFTGLQTKWIIKKLPLEVIEYVVLKFVPKV